MKHAHSSALALLLASTISPLLAPTAAHADTVCLQAASDCAIAPSGTYLADRVVYSYNGITQTVPEWRSRAEVTYTMLTLGTPRCYPWGCDPAPASSYSRTVTSYGRGASAGTAEAGALNACNVRRTQLMQGLPSCQ
jgi:hypothetical protein